MSDFSGTGVAVITPFNSEGNVDIDALRNIINHLIEGQVDYLVALGTTAETPVLSSEEKKRILGIFFQEAENKVPVVIGAGGSHTDSICEEVEVYTSLYRPSGFLSVCPFYSKPTQQGMYEHFHAISASTDLPIILYNIPGRTGINLQPETVVSLASNHSNIVAIKECSGDLSQSMYIEVHKPRFFQLLGGDDQLSIPMMSIGATGVISVLANAFPRLYSNMLNHALKSDYRAARRCFYQLYPLMKVCFEEGNPAGIKGIMHELGFCLPDTRLPIVPASDKLRKKIVKELTSVQTDASSNR